LNVNSKQPPDNLKVFTARCDAIALLWQVGEYGLDERSLQRAVDQAFAASLGLDPDTAQLIMARAFSRVRDDLGGWIVP
jgi:hypothetical protein